MLDWTPKPISARRARRLLWRGVITLVLVTALAAPAIAVAPSAAGSDFAGGQVGRGSQWIARPPLRQALRLVTLRRQYPAVSRQSWDWCRLASGLADEHAVELARLLFDLVDADSLMLLESSEEAQLLARCVRQEPPAVWDDLARRLAEGSWRIQMHVRGWFLDAVPVEIITEWIGNDVERARLVASMASPGDEEPTPVARYLLERFSGDREVTSGLWGQFISGFWTGPESERLAKQIGQLNAWRQHLNEPLGVRTWARDMIRSLEAQRAAALEREAERGY
jgi:hypothetical protein